MSVRIKLVLVTLESNHISMFYHLQVLWSREKYLIPLSIQKAMKRNGVTYETDFSNTKFGSN